MMKLLWRPMAAILATALVASAASYAICVFGGTMVESAAAMVAILLVGLVPIVLWMNRLTRAAGVSNAWKPTRGRLTRSRLALIGIYIGGLLIAVSATYGSYVIVPSRFVEVPLGLALGTALAALSIPWSIAIQAEIAAFKGMQALTARIQAVCGVILSVNLALALGFHNVEPGLLGLHNAIIAGFSVIIPLQFSSLIVTRRLERINA